MCSEDLLHLICEVEKKQNSDARAALNILKMITNSVQSIASLDVTLAEKRIRKLCQVPIRQPFTTEK